MRNYITLFLILLLVSSTKKLHAQYHITSHTWVRDTFTLMTTGLDTSCSYSPYLRVTTDAWAPGLKVKYYFNDGTWSIQPVINDGSTFHAYCPSGITLSGQYTVKQVLMYGTSMVDSITVSSQFLTCQTYFTKCFYDSENNCTYNFSHDPSIAVPMKIEVDSNGNATDTISATSGFYYVATGPIGTIYSFKIITNPSGLIVTCPSGGIIYDTVSTSYMHIFPTKYFGFRCSGSSGGIDYGVHTSIEAFENCNIIVDNMSCNTSSAVLTANFSSNFISWGCSPAPISISGNVFRWNLNTLSVVSPRLFYVKLSIIPGLAIGASMNSVFSIDTAVGETDLINNTQVIADTFTGSYDPNEMTVTPLDVILSGTQLHYAVSFENTGNDTAFNIYVIDTLSDNTDMSTFEIESASAKMNISKFNYNGHHVIKFDFPDINLLDSAHHGACTGTIFFTIRSKYGLLDGTTIFNHAGIFFDYNPVVNTNIVENVIGTPSRILSSSEDNLISLFPNPTQSNFTISSHSKITSIIINNIFGQTVRRYAFNSENVVVDVADIPTGLYIVRINGTDMRKFVKE
jgi:uncharacterized repeat protein (TIGR01451 family)